MRYLNCLSFFPSAHRKSVIFATLLISIFFIYSCREPSPGASSAELGKPAPNFKLGDSKGRVWNLADLKGNVIFLNFWATWCPPCREEMPSMEALNRSLDSVPFQMLTILNNDDPAQADTFLRKLNSNLPVLVDADGRTAAAYGITGVPETFIIDAKGILRKKIIGGHDWNSQPAKDLIKSYLP
ncbi:MAG: hypothetical protein A2511_03060 [Deltaproteobacteria bacterium RIFOXYD12_FULL_50_9]|nr:MAG: hypothetical protein A2511_03060 [Deltaproteobacteria bacterium RIFOXYD12_FULL_50_9]